ncbi:hypothetical protein sS8_1385 [Methylocaldum marinum]|uniref:Uncharacterized protein n=1 Tax=Methylocaldum marinum TaxID=1432792 RepID=A0A250KNT7_9GAMM|nr:hypothetical protein [Methylocaldum marinum]BBA33345.1 hypothetical protein sS8_1385 [Methylocaldum marinum]
MNSRNWKRLVNFYLPAFTALAVAWSPAFVAEFWLRTDKVDHTIPHGTSMSLWGFRSDTIGFISDSRVSATGPILTVSPAGVTEAIDRKKDGMAGPVSLSSQGRSAEIGPPRD